MRTSLLPSSIAALALLAGCARHERSAAPAEDNSPPIAVHVALVKTTNLPGIDEVTGTVRPVQRASIAAKVMGTITELPVALGQRVRAGEVLAKISAAEISARVAQANAQLNQARRDLEREKNLLTKNASTPDMVKSLEDRVAMTEAMVREADTMLGYTEVRAPFDGVVARKISDAGDLAAPGAPLLEIEGENNFYIEAGIPDMLATKLANGATLRVEVPAAGASFSGAIIEISSAADAHAHTVTAKISVPAGSTVRSGQFARVQIPGTAAPALLVPAAAVTHFGEMERVFVVREGRAVLRLVKTGATRDGAIEILSGVADGESVVIDPPAALREGRRVEAVR